VLSLALGALSLTCFGVFSGIPAIVLGSIARREIDRSGGRLTGSALAAGGVVAGLFGTGISLVLAVTLASNAFEATAGFSDEPHARVAARAAATRSYGELDVIDLDGARPLGPQLADVARVTSAKGRTLILQTYSPRSVACAEVAAALPDPRMQRALANVTLLRVDAERFADDLHALHLETGTAPWFYILDAAGRPVDAINADEWDDNVPENMAPVLAKFARGTLAARRQRTAPPPGGLPR
jgi:hypothetical protein